MREPRTGRAVCRSLSLLLAAIAVPSFGSPSGWATQAVDVASASTDVLIERAQRTASTPAEKEAKMAAWREVRARGTNALPDLMELIHLENIGIQVLAFQIVRKEEPRAGVLDVLMPYTRATNAVTRKMAVYFLGFTPAPASMKAVRALLEDEAASGAAIRTLGKWGDTGSVSSIMQVLDHEDERKRVVAVNALRDIGSTEAIPALADRLDDAVFTVRRVAGRALAAFGAAAEPVLLQRLETATTPRHRRALLRVLGRVGTGTALGVLQGRPPDEDEWIRWERTRAVADIRARHPQAGPAP